MSMYNYDRRRDDPYHDYDWDNDGFPGEYVYGDYVYVDEYYMDEVWKPINDFPDYWVSDKGRIYSNISNSFIYGTPNVRSGHIDVSLQRGGVRYHRYLHRLVADAFIPNPYNYPIVRHLNDDPYDNSVINLAWGTQYDNTHDSIRNGTFRYFDDEDRENAMKKRRMPVVAVRFSNGKKLYFNSQHEASRELCIKQSNIYNVISGKHFGSNGYYFAKSNEPFDNERYEYAKKHYVKQRSLIKAISINTGEEFIFRGLYEASRELNVSMSSISNILHEKNNFSKGWTFEYLDEEEYNDGYY